MPSYAPAKPVTLKRKPKLAPPKMPLGDHWQERVAVLTETLRCFRMISLDETFHLHISRAQAHLALLNNVTRNKEYERVFRLITLEVKYALRLSSPR